MPFLFLIFGLATAAVVMLLATSIILGIGLWAWPIGFIAGGVIGAIVGIAIALHIVRRSSVVSHAA